MRVLIHSSLAVTLTYTPLGLTAAKFWTRTKFKTTLALKRYIESHARADRDEEELPLAGEPAPVHRARGAPGRCVHVGDRESDIYAQDLGTSFLVGVQTNRLSERPADATTRDPDQVALDALQCHGDALADANTHGGEREASTRVREAPAPRHP